MAEEEKKCSSDSCGGGAGGSGRGGRGGGAWSASRFSKKQKQKQKKPPQRGLGIAKLERLRLEEQRQKDAASFYPYPPTFSYFCPSASLLNFGVASEFSPSDSFFRHIPSVPNMDLAATGPVPSPCMRNYRDYDAEIWRQRRVTDHELDLGSKMNMPLESNLAMGEQGQTQRAGSDQPPLLVNASPLWSASMSLQSYPLEPPSNQSHHHGSFAPFRPQGDKVSGGGVKRSYPFSLENPPAPCFPLKIHKVGNPIMNRPEDPSSFSGIDNLREGPSRSSSMLESSSTDSVKANKVSGGECLTLAPPMDTPSWQNWNHSQHFAYSASRSYNPYPGFEFPQYQGYPEGLVYRQAAPGWTDQRPFQQPYYNFLPTTIPPSSVENTHTNERSKEDFLPPTIPPSSVENTHTNGRSKEDMSEDVNLNLNL